MPAMMPPRVLAESEAPVRWSPGRAQTLCYNPRSVGL